MLNFLVTAIAFLRRLGVQREGNVAMIFGLAAIPVIVAGGIAVDATRAYMVKVRLGAAMDAAALAVGSTENESLTQLSTRLTNYFKANYPASAIGADVTITPVPGNANLTASQVTFQAQATVPMTIMRVVGFQPVTVTVTNQIRKTAGLEVVLVLDNTGSMLCGPNDGAPNYSAALCQGGVIASDTTCTNPSNQSRICVLRNAATQFVNTLTSAISSAQQLYIGVVPYVTTVNVGGSLCSSGTNCNSMETDGCTDGDWISQTGTPIYSGPVAAAALTGNLTNSSKIVTNISPSTTGLAVGTLVAGTGIPNGTTVASIDSSSQIHLSANATATRTNSTITIKWTGNTAAGSNIITNILPNTTGLTVGAVLIGPTSGPNGLPTNGVAITSIDNANQVHICNAATSTSTAIVITPNTPINYDTTHTSTTQQWMGCVVEPTSSDENKSGGGGLIAHNSAAADPDTTEPVAGTKWYPFWWPAGYNGIPPIGKNPTINNWTSGTIQAQTNTTEVQGAVTTDWETFNGPNEGCPVPLLPLTDVTTTAGKNAVLNTINSMWPRDAGGTQVHIGMIWGWRTLSSNGPFAQNNGHPMDYGTANTQGWKKVVVLMTDGTEEWPDSNGYTGLGWLSEGKIGVNNNSTNAAQTNLDTRLQNVCANMAASAGNFIVYSIGLGSDGQSNTSLHNCVANGGFFSPATTGNLQSVFNTIAQSLIALRLAR
ncbi:MAG TPA: TadE/TadG family type IV pilus assembly protein [Stellaceae bacterium]|nr:TadE/TadG family type IV pilus assembly protein [Stellaceae bacterium]